MQEPVFSSGDVALQVGIARWRLAYLIDRGKLPNPSFRVPGRRLFTAEDVRCIREKLAEMSACTTAG